MKPVPAFVLAFAATSLFATTALANAVVGLAAPAFTATDSNGKSHALADFKGKSVVLEWTNAECPFVKKHYGAGNMQALQKEMTAKGVVWLTVNSSAAGNQGSVNGTQANARMKQAGFASTAYLLDTDGKLGKLYGAKTTPHMYVIDPKGTLAYAGAIDDKPSADPADIKGAKNYVRLALADIGTGKPVATAQTKPYGCGVKYK